jgi:DNA invertase Pin-like site-specific DNA recombinase
MEMSTKRECEPEKWNSQTGRENQIKDDFKLMQKTARRPPNSPRRSRVAGAIVSILKQQEAGIPIKEICRQHGISEATFYNWNRTAEAEPLRRHGSI